MKYTTVSVYTRDKEAWRRRIFTNAFVRWVSAVKTDGGGRRAADSLTVRIFSPGARTIKAGDKISVGVGGLAPGEEALTVCEVCDNFILSRGGHMRITAR